MTSVFVDQPQTHGSVENIVFVNRLVKTLFQNNPYISKEHLSALTFFLSEYCIVSFSILHVCTESVSLVSKDSI